MDVIFIRIFRLFQRFRISLFLRFQSFSSMMLLSLLESLVLKKRSSSRLDFEKSGKKMKKIDFMRLLKNTVFDFLDQTVLAMEIQRSDSILVSEDNFSLQEI